MIFSTKSQDLYNKNILQIADLGVYELSDFSIRVLYLLLRQQMFSGKVFYSHETIASLAGCSVSTIRRALIKLRSLGLIKWQQRRDKSCLYFISSVLLIKSNLKRIQQFFSTYFKCILPKSLLSPKKSPECGTWKNEQLSKFKGIFNMVFSYLSNRVNEINPDDPFGDRTKEPPVFKKTEPKREDGDYSLRDTIITTIEKSLPLTEHGRLKLRQYPSQALKVAQKDINIALKRQDPFIHLLWICERYSKENGLFVERGTYNQICYRKGIDTQDNNFYDKDTFEQSKMNTLNTPKRAPREDFSGGRQPIYRPEPPRADIPKDLSFLEQVSVENSTAAYFRDILLGKVKVIY